MLYLAIQMAFLLLVSALVGVIIGWWAKRVSQPSREELEEALASDAMQTNDEIYTLKHKLDKCLDENASLRRDVKTKQTQLNRLNTRYGQSAEDNDDSGTTSVDALYDKVKALMDDLQLRDDTILALEKEIEAMKNKG